LAARRKKKRDPAREPEPRSCGECRACCVSLGFQARAGESPFDKPAGEPCPHLMPPGAGGCRIYEERPPVCRRFQCGWLQAAHLPEALRPDRCGVLFSLNDAFCVEGSALYAYELRPGATNGRLPAQLIAELSTRITVIIVRDEGCEVLTADANLQARLDNDAAAFSAANDDP
jgi:hypothetical protein